VALQDRRFELHFQELRERGRDFKGFCIGKFFDKTVFAGNGTVLKVLLWNDRFCFIFEKGTLPVTKHFSFFDDSLR